uniref:Nucleotide-diphospho-sugar transferase domain-containing protein n=1 Tax=Heligmosomoides polygyrus TaxID=6339 RepID=A0A8L8Q4J7_HELPZ
LLDGQFLFTSVSVACYARAQGYEFRIFISTDFASLIHCIYNYLHIIFRRFEDYIDNGTEIAFFDRFYNWEIAAGSYIVRNSNWSQQFLKGFADYEYRLPTEYHGTDNGALHAYIAEMLFSDTRRSELEFCLRIYYNLKSYKDLFTFEACVRQMIGMHTKIGNIQIYKKGTAWVRDNWMTNSKWSPDKDFMLHNWKIHQLRRYRQSDLLHGASKAEWFNPFKGIIQLELCAPG